MVRKTEPYRKSIWANMRWHHIVHIFYLGEDQRSRRLVLRLANQIYLHAVLVREIIGTVTTSITPRKLYGQYYHSISTHAPILYRLINLKSVNAEHQERLFNSLKGIFSQTTSRRPNDVLGMSLVRLQAEQMRERDLGREESEISTLGKNLRSVLPPPTLSSLGSTSPHLELK
ncbi:hypothetical protein Bbelb_110420 [Branchiostoma belcheri]|nr:hypothetical protein Bbelb_110420 [Branchiostoma belcheri]